MVAAAIVTIHHQGAGAPNDTPQPEYTYWISPGGWQRIQSVADSWATSGENGISLDICLSGNRMNYVVTDTDVSAIGAVFQDCLARGEVTATPHVQPHKAVYNTACPGTHTMARWPDIVAVCHAAPKPMVPTDWSKLMTTVADPNHVGGTARPIPPLHAVLLENGARLSGDKPSGTEHVWTSPDPTILALLADANTAFPQLVDICPTAKGDGIFVLFAIAENEVRSYFVPWQP
jgi:hypothetical protein